MTTQSNNLLVPMNVDALAVGKTANNWILQVPNFADNMDKDGNFLGYQQLPPDMWNPFPCPYEQGIHLRWALPDGLTHGSTANATDRSSSECGPSSSAADATDPSYPEVPNRWIILRLYTDYSKQSPKPSARAWIVESDFIAEETKQSRASQWPVLPTISDPPKSFKYVRYVGRQMDFSSWPSSNAAQYLSDLGGKLTAVGYGSSTYAAYYPVCSTVFGFYDDMSNFAGANSDNPVSLTYLVAGWYFDPGKDVLYGYANSKDNPHCWQDRMAELKWSWYHVKEVDGKAPPPPSPQPTRTITHGFVSQINWTGRDTTYNYGPDPQLSPQLAVGNTSLEALAALTAANASGDVDRATLEKVLLAFQSDLLSVYDKYKDSAAIDRELDELLHTASFGSRDGGVVYEVRRKDANAPAGADRSGDAARGVALPAELSTALADLNRIQYQLDAITSELTSYQEAYFHAWHKKADGANVDDTVLSNLEQTIRTNQIVLHSLSLSFNLATTTAKQAIETFLPEYELSSSASLRYWQPGDFALLVANVGRTFRHGEDGRYTQSGNLRCRISGSTLTELDFTPAGGNKVKMPVTAIGSAVPTHSGSGPSGDFDTAIQPDIEALFLETILLDPNQAQFLANTFGANSGFKPEDLAPLIAKQQAINWNDPAPGPEPDFSESKGEVPSHAAVTYWLDSNGQTGNPWIPLMMQWKFDWCPTYESGSGVAQALKGWIFNGTDYEPDALQPVVDQPATHYEGITILTPVAVWNMQKRLEDYNSRNPNNPDLTAIAELISALSKFDLMSQVSGGANLSLTMRQQSLQLPPISRSTGGLATVNGGETVIDLIGKRYETAPSPWSKIALGNNYFPVRAGHAVLTGINIVDAFGQFLPLPKEVFQNLTISTQLTGKEPGHIKLAPRLSQPGRLNFELVSATNDSVVTAADSATTPICGWLVSDYLDCSLLVSSAEGELLGKLGLDAEQKKVLWRPDPVQCHSPQAPQAPIANPHLSAMQSALLKISGDDFSKFLKYIEQVEETIYPPASQINTAVSALMGSAIAVVRAALRLELDGLPLVDQSQLAAFQDHGYSEIAFPVALGDIGQPDDGLFGYFAPASGTGVSKSPADNTDYNTFYTASGADVGDFKCTYIVQPDPNAPQLRLAAYKSGKPSSSTYATLLVDPRTQIKLQSGILPATTLMLPPQDTAAVLASHEIFFQVSPVVGSAGTLSLPHPSKKYGNWSWLNLEENSGGGPWKSTWNEVHFDQKTGKDGLPLYPLMIRDGWLRLCIPSASGKAILYFAVSGGTYLVKPGATINLTWAAKLGDANCKLQLKVGDGVPQTVPNQSPGFAQTVQATTTYTLCLIDATGKEVDHQKLMVQVLS